MRRTSLLLLTLLALPALAAAAGETRRSGTVVEVAADGGRLTIEEMVAWTGPGAGLVRHEVTVTPRTSVRRVVRDEDPARAALTGFRETPVPFAEVRPGDFVTVVTREDEGHGTAVAVELVRPDDAGSASPR